MVSLLFVAVNDLQLKDNGNCSGLQLMIGATTSNAMFASYTNSMVILAASLALQSTSLATNNHVYATYDRNYSHFVSATNAMFYDRVADSAARQPTAVYTMLSPREYISTHRCVHSRDRDHSD
eukprot:CAMPEP_0202710196 /NCGR_PEP_ID=MMETSP1385-20130828/22215_1 /ASSEMBLY_ACC=CAM_ASM_000861 /TAXON_ID=933848 /ORGANISM="Elphidium margaritaceum" /LENGTH=122 /DNA_ID=CAMNT_0049369671 /DNA_START=31 /DNA_END=400 /DNA_ORIENTATION=+